MAERTALGTLVLGAGWLGVLVGLVLGTLAPVLVGVVLIAFMQGARGYLAGTRLAIDRDVPERAHLDEPVTLHIEARAQRRVPIEIHDQVPAGLRVLERSSTHGLGESSQTIDAIPEETGTLRWHEATVRIRDPWGLTQETRRVPAPATLRIGPEPAWATEGKQVGRANPVRETAKSQRAYEPVPEIRYVREYQPGDRVRDIDWARTSRQPGIFTREREREGPRPVVILLDARESMRWRRGRSKLSTASQLAYGVAAAAEAAGVRASLVAFSDNRVERAGTLSGNRAGIVGTLERLADLAGPKDVTELPETAATEHTISGEERTFLKALSPFVQAPAPASTPLESALAALDEETSTPAFVVAILDGEQTPGLAATAIDRIKRKGHDAALVLPATGAHHYQRHEARGRVLDRLVTARRNRHQLSRRLDPKDVAVVPLLPGFVDDALEEVMRSAR